jgi:hypothetical protein
MGVLPMSSVTELAYEGVANPRLKSTVAKGQNGGVKKRFLIMILRNVDDFRHQRHSLVEKLSLKRLFPKRPYVWHVSIQPDTGTPCEGPKDHSGKLARFA